MSFPRYAKYKDSGVEWLGEVPAHWAVVPVKHVADFQNGDAFKPSDWSDTGTPIIRIQNLNGGDDFNFFEGDVEPRYLVHRGDLLFGWSGNRGTSFGPFLWPREGVFVLNQHIFRVLPRSTDVRSLYWLLRAVTAHVEEQAHGIIGMVHITKSDLGAISVPVPPLPEQTAISAFLDSETAKIDALVAEQQRLMDLLKEKRQAVISHAVTKGLNPRAPMKPSGIEWLGDVPAHWAVAPFKYCITKIEQGWSPQCDNEPAAEGEWGVLKVGCGNGDEFDPNEQKALPAGVEPIEEYELRPKDILMSRGNTQDLVGMATFVERPRPRLLISDLLYRFQAEPERAEGEFLVFSLRSPNLRFQLERDAVGTSASMKKVSQGTIRELVLALPPLAEQRSITAFIRIAIAKLDALTTESQRAIDLLQERRTALISAAVTGQIDVRHLAVREAA